MASAQEIMSASGPASPLVGRCSSLVETASPLAHTPATLEVVAPPSVPMYTSRPLMPLRLLVCVEPSWWVLHVSTSRCALRGAQSGVRHAHGVLAGRRSRDALRYSLFGGIRSSVT